MLDGRSEKKGSKEGGRFQSTEKKERDNLCRGIHNIASAFWEKLGQHDTPQEIVVVKWRNRNSPRSDWYQDYEKAFYENPNKLESSRNTFSGVPPTLTPLQVRKSGKAVRAKPALQVCGIS